MRYRADLRTLLFVAIYAGLVAYQFIAPPTHLAVAIPVFVLTCWFSFFGAVATHNTVHCPVFHDRTANRLFQCALTLTYGHPVSAFVPGHNLSHHKHTQTRRDVMRTTKMRFGWNLLNGLLFFVTVGPSIMKGETAYYKTMASRSPAWFRQLLMEFGVLYGVYAVLLLLNWKAFLLYVFLPHKYAAWGIISMNFLQHDGTDQDHPYNHSRNFTGKIVNWFTLNNGYHGIHHVYPGLHWSLTPEAHAKELHGHLHPELEQASLLTYLWKTFVWPGKRLRYDGAPVVLPEEGPDESWLPKPNETPEDLGAVAVT